MPTVLLADDNSQNLYMLEVLLKGHGFSVMTATDGKEALASALAVPPDIVVSDILMPVMDGYSLCREWKKHERLRTIPFVFYTATYTEAKDEALALGLGADRFVIKPQEPEVLVNLISDVLAGAPIRRAAPADNGVKKDSEFLKGYSETLFRKLEKKMADLEQAKIKLEYEIDERKGVNDELNQLNLTLEERVAERTAQLAEANRGLEEELKWRSRAQEEIDSLNRDLEKRSRTLENTNRELEAFSYSVSHDLRAPLRHIAGFVEMLREDYGATLAEEGRECLTRISNACRKMNELIKALLNLSEVTRTDIHLAGIDLSCMAREISASLRESEPDRQVTFNIANGIVVQADGALMRSVMENMLNNSWKYTRCRESAVIEFGSFEQDGQPVCFVRDNGAGFDMQFAEKLFVTFQRLHCEKEYEGTGIGLATVQRIIHRHGGKVWAEGKIDEGATFYFTL